VSILWFLQDCRTARSEGLSDGLVRAGCAFFGRAEPVRPPGRAGSVELSSGATQGFD
jgi:hypothetical protein